MREEVTKSYQYLHNLQTQRSYIFNHRKWKYVNNSRQIDCQQIQKHTLYLPLSNSKLLVTLYLSLPLCPSLQLCLSLQFYFPLPSHSFPNNQNSHIQFVSPTKSVCLPMCLLICLSAYVSAYMFVFLCASLPMCLSVCPCFYLSVLSSSLHSNQLYFHKFLLDRILLNPIESTNPSF